MLQIYNSLSQTKTVFKPLNPNEVGLYVCGITVYDHCHIGHGRMFLVFDMVARYLRFSGFMVKYVRNITDVDDKIIKRALSNGEAIGDLTKRYIQSMHEDTQALNMLNPDVEPKATLYIDKMIALIETLIEKKAAYQANNGDVYFNVKSFVPYGEMANRDFEEALTGARVEINPFKKDPRDFVLWKLAKQDEPSWPAPWGDGRPGWHIECSAMSLDCLGESFDIHGGGPDLKFPHHENERAQSETATGKTFVQIWMHTGFLQRDMEKMSKSADNFLTIKDFLKHYQAEVLRYFMLASHYRSPIEYSLELIDNAKTSLQRLYTALRGLPFCPKPQQSLFELSFKSAMDDDFNTPMALAVLFDLSHEINRCKVAGNLAKAAELGSLLQQLGGVLGLLQMEPESYLKSGGNVSLKHLLSDDEVEHLIQRRHQARGQQNWLQADAIRQELAAQGIILEDQGQDTTWRR